MLGADFILKKRAVTQSVTTLFFDGAKRIRTADPLNAIEMRYQLRYSPLTNFSVYL